MVYLIHFNKKFKHAQHYLGFCYDKNFKKRIKHHLNGNGACLLNALNKLKISYKVVKTWPEKDGNFERELKNYKNASIICPVCNSGYKGKYK